MSLVARARCGVKCRVYGAAEDLWLTVKSPKGCMRCKCMGVRVKAARVRSQPRPPSRQPRSHIGQGAKQSNSEWITRESLEFRVNHSKLEWGESLEFGVSESLEFGVIHA